MTTERTEPEAGQVWRERGRQSKRLVRVTAAEPHPWGATHVYIETVRTSSGLSPVRPVQSRVSRRLWHERFKYVGIAPKDETGSVPVHVVFLLDRSGSMASMHSDVVGGFNTFVEDQKAMPGACVLTLAQFDSQGFDLMYDASPIGEVQPMRLEDFKPRGGTPLLDSIGRAVTLAQSRVESLPTPENQLVVILTDGQENQSREYTRQSVKALIESKEAQGWTFAYLGCDANAYAEAGSIGFSFGSTQAYAPDGAGMAVAMASLSSNTRSHRAASYSGASIDPKNFYVDKGAERDAAKRGKPVRKS